MVVDVMALLHDLGFTVGEGTGAENWLLRSPEGAAHLVRLAPAVERITAHTLRVAGASTDRVLFVGRHATAGVLARARSGELDVLTEEPPAVIINGTTFGDPTPAQPARVRRSSARPAWLRWALERILVTAETPLLQREIAALLRTSQQTISNAAKHLGPLIFVEDRHLMAQDRRAMLEHFLGEYPGAGGQQFGWYVLDTPVNQAEKAAEVATVLGASPLITADVAADRLGPWKLPSRAMLYVSSPVDLTDDGFVPAPIEEATLTTCVPQDPTLWHLASGDDGEHALADPVIVCWDLLQGTDVDSAEAVEHLKKIIVDGAE